MSDIEKEEHHTVDRSDDVGGPEIPYVNALTYNDLRECLLHGLRDFGRAPIFGLFFGGIYALGGIAIVMSLYVWEKGWLIYPMLVGFPLIGPFTAVGLYEISRRLGTNQPLKWNEILTVVVRQRTRELPWMAFVILFLFWIWMYQVRLLLAIFLGRISFTSWDRFFEIITTTPEGWMFVIVGHIVGACFALLLFSITVISLPLLLDSELDFISAMITSVKTVLNSPLIMLAWGVFVTLAILASFVPMFFGLLFVLPVLGHTTWHIYKRAVVQQA